MEGPSSLGGTDEEPQSHHRNMDDGQSNGAEESRIFIQANSAESADPSARDRIQPRSRFFQRVKNAFCKKAICIPLLICVICAIIFLIVYIIIFLLSGPQNGTHQNSTAEVPSNTSLNLQPASPVLLSGPQNGTHQNSTAEVPSTTSPNLQPSSPEISQHKRCPDDWTFLEEKCYRISNKTDTWLAAYNHCIAMGGRLPGRKDTEDRNYKILIQKLGISEKDRVWTGCLVSSVSLKICPDDPKFNETLSKVIESDHIVECVVLTRSQLKNESSSDLFPYMCVRDALVP